MATATCVLLALATMTPERITPTELKNLILSEGPAITLVTSVDHNGSARIETRKELQRLQEQAASAGPAAQELLKGLEQDIEKAPGHFAFLRAPGVSLTWPVDQSVAPVAELGPHFNIRTLLSVANCQKLFYILALSQKRTRILECTERTSAEVPFPAGYAFNLHDFKQTRQPDHTLDNRRTAGPSSGGSQGVMFGTNTDGEDRDEYMLHFFMNLDKAMHVFLNGRSAPLVVAGVEHELALYNRVSTYPRLVTPGVHGAPDGLHGGEMHARALEILAQDPTDPRRVALADFEKRVGTGHASAHVQQIVIAAYEGRVSHLFFQENAHYEGTFDGMRQRVKHHLDDLDHKEDLIEEAAYQTVLHGGEATVAPGSMMPNGVPVCAFFRYPESSTSAGADAPDARVTV